MDNPGALDAFQRGSDSRSWEAFRRFTRLHICNVKWNDDTALMFDGNIAIYFFL